MSEIMFIGQRVPWPPDRGDKIRSHHILRRLAKIAPVHVATFAENEADEDHAAAMAEATRTQCVVRRDKPLWRAGAEAIVRREPISLSAFRDERLADYVGRTLRTRPIDRLFVFSGQMAQYVPEDFAGRVIVDFCDVDSAKFESYARDGNPAMRVVNAREGRLLRAFEEQAAHRANASLLVTEAEAALFESRLKRSAYVQVMRNGIDHAFFDPHADFPPADVPGAAAPLIVFTGQMDYRPNIEAVSDFAINVLPAIRAVRPDARFAIVGRAPTAAVQALGSRPGVIVTGAVPDIRSWLAAATLVVAPLRIARGIQNKVLEAMAMARPVLVSSAAATGIDARDGTHFRVASSAAEEARIAIELLADPVRMASLGRAGRAHVIEHYGWEAALGPLDTLMSDKRRDEGAA